MKSIENPKLNSANRFINLSCLPPEILFQCFSYLKSVKDLVSLSKTNHTLRKIALNDSLWEEYQHYLPNPVIKKYIVNKNHQRQKFTEFAVLTNGLLAVGLPSIIYFFETVSFKRMNIKIPAPKNNTLIALPDNQLAVGFKNGKILVWKINFHIENNSTGKRTKLWRKKEKSNFKWHTTRKIKAIECKLNTCCDGIKALATLPDGFLASGGSCEGNIYIWNINSGKCNKILRKHSRHVTALAALPDNKLASGSGAEVDNYDHPDPIRIWDLNSGQCTLEFDTNYYSYNQNMYGPNQNLKGATNALQALPNGYLAVAKSDNPVRIWNIKNGKFVKEIPAFASKFVIHPHGELVIYCLATSNIMYFWDVHRNKCIKRLNFGSQQNTNTTYSNIIALEDGKLICGRFEQGLFVFKFPSIPENLLEQPDEKTEIKLT